MNAVQDLVTSWLNPTALFCVVNIMIGAIFFLKAQNKHEHSHTQPENPHHHQHRPELARSPSFGGLYKNPPEEEADPGPQAERGGPSFFERVRSFNFNPSENRPEESEREEPPEEPTSHRRDGGDVVEHVETGAADGSSVTVDRALKKSASERLQAATEKGEAEVEGRRPETSRERTEAGDEAVDARADDFINRFRQQLKMQRLDSILRYKEMLNRGASL